MRSRYDKNVEDREMGMLQAYAHCRDECCCCCCCDDIFLSDERFEDKNLKYEKFC